jgi:hypothetical protein
MSFSRQYDYLTTPVRYTSYATETTVVSPKKPSPVTSEEAYRFVPIHDKVSDKLVVRLIEAATSKVENYTNYDVTLKTRTAYFLHPRTKIYLPFGIHGAIDWVKAIDGDGHETELVLGTDFIIEGQQKKTIVLKRNYYSVLVQYISGFTEPPDAFIGAILHEYSLLYKNRNDPNQAPRQVINGLSAEARLLLVDGGYINYHG